MLPRMVIMLLGTPEGLVQAEQREEHSQEMLELMVLVLALEGEEVVIMASQTEAMEDNPELAAATHIQRIRRVTAEQVNSSSPTYIERRSDAILIGLAIH